MFWTFGCRNLIVETDAKYIHGMLNNPGEGPNATINRWIEDISMFHFELRHVPGVRFAPDGLSRRPAQPGDENPELPEDLQPDPIPKINTVIPEGVTELPLDFEEFKTEIDKRGGYLQTVAESEVPEQERDFEQQLLNV